MMLGRGARLIIGVLAMLLAAGCAGIPHQVAHPGPHLLSQGRSHHRKRPARIRRVTKKRRAFHRRHAYHRVK
jgi:hypothetical protein